MAVVSVAIAVIAQLAQKQLISGSISASRSRSAWLSRLLSRLSLICRSKQRAEHLLRANSAFACGCHCELPELTRLQTKQQQMTKQKRPPFEYRHHWLLSHLLALSELQRCCRSWTSDLLHRFCCCRCHCDSVDSAAGAASQRWRRQLQHEVARNARLMNC